MSSSVISDEPETFQIDELLERAGASGRSFLLEHETHDLLRSFGIAVPDSVFIPADRNLLTAAEGAWESLWGSKVVIKVMSPEILHKSDLGGVKIVDKLPAEIFDTIESMQERLSGFDVHGFLVSELVEYDPSPGGELLANIRWTAEFGPVVSLGLGGVTAEFLGKSLVPGTEIAVFAPGLTPVDRIASVLDHKTLTPLLTGTLRNQKPRLDRRELHSLVERLLRLAEQLFPSPLDELEINPLVVGPQGLTALDAFVRVGEPRSMPAPRPLDKIRRLLEPESIAVVGVSRSMNPGRIIVRNLLREGFARDRIRIVKRDCQEIEGCACVGSIEDLDGPVDLVILSIGAEDVPRTIEKIVETETAESVIVIPGGLGEREGTGSLEQTVRTVLEKSRATRWGGPVVNGGNSLGIRSVAGNYDTMFLPHYKVAASKRPGDGIAVISQSGAFAASLASRLDPISPRTIVSIGNQIDLTVGDYMNSMADDPSVDLFAFYVEGFRPGDGRSWLDGVERATGAGRPVILYRAGRTPEGSRATASHTAALAGDAVVTRELARGSGAIVAESLDEFEDLIRTFWLLRDRTPEGVRIGALSNGGFECVAMADNPGPFRFVPLSPETVVRIEMLFAENRLDAIMNVANPLDVNPLMHDDAFAEAVRLVVMDPGVDLAAIGCVPLTGSLRTLPAGSEHDEDVDSELSVASRLGQMWRHTTKPWVAVVDAGALYDPFASSLLHHGIPTFRRADRAMKALATWVSWKRALKD